MTSYLTCQVFISRKEKNITIRFDSVENYSPSLRKGKKKEKKNLSGKPKAAKNSIGRAPVWRVTRIYGDNRCTDTLIYVPMYLDYNLYS